MKQVLTDVQHAIIFNHIQEAMDIFRIPHREPFDGDDTEDISKILLIMADYNEGNITRPEYTEKLSEHLIIVDSAKEITHKMVSEYKPEGISILREDGVWVGVDNMDGHAWTEEFNTLEDAIAWVIGKQEKD